MNILILDVETTISNSGHFADKTNKLVMVGLKLLNKPSVVFDVLSENYKPNIQSWIDEADILVGFNIKFDLHWLKNYGVEFSNKSIWDCQLAEFLFESQQNKYPSLDNTLKKYGYESKLDIVKSEYWNKGIDTDKIPRDILTKYLMRDLEATGQVFNVQKELFKDEHKNKYKLFQLQCEDLKVLQEIEYNGLFFNSEAARKEATTLDEKMEGIKGCIIETADIPACVSFNLNSNDHLSAILYGGSIFWYVKIPDGVYKSGEKVGHIKYKNKEMSKTFSRLVEPLDRTETKKSKNQNGEPSSWSVAEDVLKQLKAKGKAKIIIDNLLEYGKIEKLKNTYLEGFSNLIEKMNWPKNMIHSNLNQCSVVTGRLSSTKPNVQNLDKKTKKFLESRYL